VYDVTAWAAVTSAAIGLQGGGERTKSSSAAKPKFDFLGESFMVADMSTRSRDASLLNSASKVDIKGLRDIGLLPELERLALVLAGEGKAGEAALRKGLLEERLSCRPGEGRLSVDKQYDQRRILFRHSPSRGETGQFRSSLTWH
jgi:hypothetical protein